MASSQLATLVEKLRAVLNSGPPLRLAILFGSAVHEQLRPDSDLDVGIIPQGPEMSLTSELELASALSLVAGREVDLVRLDRAPALVRWEAARKHLPLLARPEVELPRFLAAAALEHADMLPLLDDAMRRLQRRLASSHVNVTHVEER